MNAMSRTKSVSPRFHLSLSVVFLFSAGLLAFSDLAHAGACLCLKSNGEGITEFSCKNVEGNNECGAHCAAQDFPGSEHYPDETCSSLHKKVKRQEIVVPVPKLDKVTEIVEIIDIVNGKVIEQHIISIPPKHEGLANAVNNEVIAASISPIPVPAPGQVTRRIIDMDAEFGPGTDHFEVPKAFGGGWSSTDDFVGDFKLRLVQKINNPELYDVFVTEVNTVVAGMNLNGFNTGNLSGSLNLKAPNQGLYNDKTGAISLLFSQFLTAESQPDNPMLTYTTYTGQCVDCLSGGKTFTLNGDSLYVAPVEWSG